MAITKQRKDDLVAQYSELLEQSKAIILADYSGLNVRQMQLLRAQVRQADGAFYVTKNTLLRLAGLFEIPIVLTEQYVKWLSRLCFPTMASPAFINILMAVGAVYQTVTLYLSITLYQ